MFKRFIMKKHVVNIVNILLILCIVSAVAFVLVKSIKKTDNASETTDTSLNSHVSTSDTATANEKFVIGVVRHTNNEDTFKCCNGFVEELKSLGCIDDLEIINILEEDENKSKTKSIDAEYVQFSVYDKDGNSVSLFDYKDSPVMIVFFN